MSAPHHSAAVEVRWATPVCAAPPGIARLLAATGKSGAALARMSIVHVRMLERDYGISRSDLRPDIYDGPDAATVDGTAVPECAA